MIIGMGLCVKNSAEAVELYKEAFGLELGYHVKNPDGSYYHSELYKDGKEMLSVVEAHDGNGNRNDIIQLGVTVADEAEVRSAAGIFLRAGAVLKAPIGPLPWSPCTAELVDPFGVWWFITAPMHHPPEEYDSAIEQGLQHEKDWDPSMYKKPE